MPGAACSAPRCPEATQHQTQPGCHCTGDQKCKGLFSVPLLMITFSFGVAGGKGKSPLQKSRFKPTVLGQDNDVPNTTF